MRRALRLAAQFVAAICCATTLTAQTAADSARRSTAAIGFVNALGRGDFAAAAALASPSVPSGALAATTLQQTWSRVSLQMGELLRATAYAQQGRDTLHAVDIDAAFQRAAVTIRVLLDRSDKVLGMGFLPPRIAPWTLPEYGDSALYREETISFGVDSFPLQGTLTLPRNVSKPPVVVLVHGSGPNDRDETLGPNKPFRDIAAGLASRGIAVFRYDKRTFVHSAKMQNVKVSLDIEVIDDAIAAAAAMRKRSDVDTTQVFVLGHSLGGYLLPEIAKRDGRLSGIVLAAAPARSFALVIAEQLMYLDTLARRSGDTTNSAIRAMIAQFDSVRSRSVPDSLQVMGVPAYYWYNLDALNAVAAVRTQASRVLVLQGGRDYQVTMQDYRLWETALQGTGKGTFKAYPLLNHLFITGTGKATPSEYQTISGHVELQVIRDIEAWVKAK